MSAMEAIFSVQQLMERYKEQNKDLHMVFIDLDKAYDKIPPDVMLIMPRELRETKLDTGGVRKRELKDWSITKELAMDRAT
jgi:hypothetical protein